MGVNEFVHIGTVMKKIRIKKGYSQKEIANMLGLPVTTYSNYENNHREPSRETIEKICEVLETTPVKLIMLGMFETDSTHRNKTISALKKEYAATQDNNIMELIKEYENNLLLTEEFLDEIYSNDLFKGDALDIDALYQKLFNTED